MHTDTETHHDRAAIVEGLMTEGIIACKGGLSRDWARRMRDDIEVAFEDAKGRPGGCRLARR